MGITYEIYTSFKQKRNYFWKDKLQYPFTSLVYYSFKETSTLLTEAEEILVDKLKVDNNRVSSPLQNVNLILRIGRHFSKAGEYLAKTFYNVKNLLNDILL